MFNKKEYMREYNKKYRLTHQEQIKKNQKKYVSAHIEKVKNATRKWQTEHPEKEKNNKKKWRLTHPEIIKEYQEKFFSKRGEYNKKYQQSPKGKQANRKYHATRKKFGFVPLNKSFIGCAGHHIDKERVIHIPRKTHEDNPHSVLRNRNMEKINELAYQFLQTRKE